MPPFTCLITGANRGIGFALAAQYLLRDNTVVVAAVRNLKSATSLSLQELPRGTGSSVVLIPYDSASEQTINTGMNLLRDEKGVTHLDVVIANAGITQSKRCQMLDVDVAELNRLVQTNSFGPLFLFRQTLPLMRQSKLATGAKFINIGSATGSSTKAELANALQLAPMGVSKAFGMMSTLFLSVEAPDILCFSICPGGVATDAYMQIHGSADSSILEGVATPKQAAEGVIRLIDISKMGTHQGGFFESATGKKTAY